MSQNKVLWRGELCNSHVGEAGIEYRVVAVYEDELFDHVVIESLGHDAMGGECWAEEDMFNGWESRLIMAMITPAASAPNKKGRK